MTSHSHSIFTRHPITIFMIDIILVIAIICLTVGVSAPLLTLQKFYFLENQISLISAITDLYKMQEWLLFILIGTFSILFPFLKIIALLAIAHLPYNAGSFSEKLLYFIERWGKWSMLDVFIVALLLVSVKLGALAQVTVHYGVYLFATAIFLTMLSGLILETLFKKSINKNN